MSMISENTNISIRHFKAALAIAEEGTFTAAAARLAVVPSALTETIRQIEEHTGVTLFDRRKRPVSPTQEGTIFLAEADDIVQRFDASLRRLRHVGGLQSGKVTVAVAPSLLQRLLGPALETFRSRHPGIGVTILDDVAGRIEQAVSTGEADFGLAARWRDNAGLAYLACGADRFGLVCNARHRLAQQPRILLADIDPLELISLGAQTGIAQMLDAAPSIPANLRTARLVAHSTIAQLLLVAQNLGVSLLPEYAAGVLGNPEVVYRQIADLQLERPLYLLRRTGMSLSPAAAALFDLLQHEP